MHSEREEDNATRIDEKKNIRSTVMMDLEDYGQIERILVLKG